MGEAAVVELRVVCTTAVLENGVDAAVINLEVVGVVAELDSAIDTAVINLGVVSAVANLERSVCAAIVAQLDFVATAAAIVGRLRLASLSHRAKGHGCQCERGNDDE